MPSMAVVGSSPTGRTMSNNQTGLTMNKPTYQMVIAAAMGYDVTCEQIRAQLSLGREFLLCKNPLGDVEFFEISEERTMLQAKRIASRMKASDGLMIHYVPGCDPYCVAWDNWKEFYASIAPEKPETYKYEEVMHYPKHVREQRRTMRNFEEVKTKLEDMPKHAGRAVYPW